MLPVSPAGKIALVKEMQQMDDDDDKMSVTTTSSSGFDDDSSVTQVRTLDADNSMHVITIVMSLNTRHNQIEKSKTS